MLAHEMDVDIWEVLEASATKPFGFQSFMPGIGPGGQCIPVNPYYISWKAREFDFHTSFIELAGDINLRMANYVMHRIHTFTTRLGISLAGRERAVPRRRVQGRRERRAQLARGEGDGAARSDEGAQVRFADPLVQSLALGDEHARPRSRSTTPRSPPPISSWCWCATRRGRSTQVLAAGDAHVRRGERARRSRRAPRTSACDPARPLVRAGPPLRVLWLIKGLGPGGAERLLVEHAATGDRDALHLRGRVPPRLEAAPRAPARGRRRAHTLPRRAQRTRPALGRAGSHRLLRRGRYDVVHAHSPFVGAVARVLVRAMPRAPSTRVRVHRAQPVAVVPAASPASPTTRTYGLNDHVFAVSADVRDSVQPRWRDRVEVIVHGVDVAVGARAARGARRRARASSASARRGARGHRRQPARHQELPGPARRGAPRRRRRRAGALRRRGPGPARGRDPRAARGAAGSATASRCSATATTPPA